jgi:hypothetical protein
VFIPPSEIVGSLQAFKWNSETKTIALEQKLTTNFFKM